MPLFNQLHPEWQEVLLSQRSNIDRIDSYLHNREISPTHDLIFRALHHPISHTRVVIVGQDPYPTKGHAHGLAFSVESSVTPLPASLRNIFEELKSDCGITRSSGDLSEWADQGVMLLNRILSTEIGSSMAHAKLGWEEITNTIASVLGQQPVVAVLWGRYAAQLAGYFKDEMVITSAHPSPLSAYRGFLGSQPFSAINSKLTEHGMPAINW
ncbi:Ung Uracil DNA glycosylase [Candidatus Nanopelagicaceae bacterium]